MNILRSKSARSVAKVLFGKLIQILARCKAGRYLLLSIAQDYARKHSREPESIWLYEYILRTGNFRDDPIHTLCLKTGVIMQLDIDDIDQRRLYFLGETEPEVTKLVIRLLRPGSVFIDIGANVGYYTLLAGQLTGKAGRVLAFEPNPDIFFLLKQNVEINNFTDRVHLFPYAVGEQHGELRLYRTTEEISGLTSRYCYSELFDASGFEVPLVTVDEIVQECHLERIDLIKMDIEGGELLALKGSSHVLNRFHPDFIVEVSPALLERMGLHEYAIFNLFAQLNYRAYSIQENGLFRIDPRLPSKIPPLGNIFFTASDASASETLKADCVDR